MAKKLTAKDIELKFWYKKLLELIGEGNMDILYDELKFELKKEGFDTGVGEMS